MQRSACHSLLRRKSLTRTTSTRLSNNLTSRKKVRVISHNHPHLVEGCASFSSRRSGSVGKQNKKGKGENPETVPQSTTTTTTTTSSSVEPTPPTSNSSESTIGNNDTKKDKEQPNKNKPRNVPKEKKNENRNEKEKVNPHEVENRTSENNKWRRKSTNRSFTSRQFSPSLSSDSRHQRQHNTYETLHSPHRQQTTPVIEFRRRFFVETLCDIIMKKLTTDPEKISVSFDSFPYYLNDALKESLILSSYIQMTQFPQWRMSPSYLRTLKTFINLTGPKGTEIYQEQLVRALAKHYGAKFVDLDIERLDLIDATRELEFAEQEDLNTIDLMHKMLSPLKIEVDYENEENSASEQIEQFYRPLVLALEMMLERDEKRYSPPLNQPKYIFFIRGLHPFVFRSIIPELRSANFLSSARYPILFVLSTVKDTKVKREPWDSFPAVLPISIFKRSKNGTFFEEREIPFPSEGIQKRLEILKEVMPNPIEVQPPKDNPQLIIQWNIQIEQDRKNYLILRNLSRLYALLDKKRIVLEGELPKLQEFSERRFAQKELEQMVIWALGYHNQRTQSPNLSQVRTSQTNHHSTGSTFTSYIDANKMPKNTEKEVESEISSSGLEDKYLSKFAYFLDLFDEESIKKQLEEFEQNLIKHGKDPSTNTAFRLLQRALATLAMRRQRQKSSNQKNTNQYNENELKESKKDETKNETEAMKEDIIEDVENENATVPRIDNPSFSNSLINIGSIPRSLTKKISKSLFHLVIFQDANELLDALPFVSFPKVHLHPEDIAQAVKLMTKLQQLDTTTYKAKTLDLNHYEQVLLSSVVYPQDIDVTFDDIGALPKVKEYLQELAILPLVHPHLFSRGNLKRAVTGVLLFGPPGTGKTMLAKAVAKESSATFINISISQITSKWYGDAEKYTAAIFSLAKKLAPSIIFIDEVDSFLSSRGTGTEHEASRRMKNEFMAHWDGLKSTSIQPPGNPNASRVLVMAATNRPFDLDDAVLRRLNRRILVDLPDKESRVQILQKLLRDESLASDFDIERLAAMTEGYTGSDLKNLCIAAAYEVVRKYLAQKKSSGNATTVAKTTSDETLPPISMEDFVAALKEVKPSVNDKSVSVSELRKWNEMYGEGKYRSVELGF